ncbi:MULTISPECIES: lactococcin 972 family bacteriocin [Oenococcus]|uniref:Lactococcin 972 family bacteriocin n=1 Tax=Oenococcus kitaharae DSM 17330 TaxID=1045004 RepID=G9WIW8_9LACO|nr:lactococcin 972 family bacteriocin [Oenococcus kitaharae]EHN58417.1 lactococcin 972 family bacteriocin [Oenococcus kitaharae DSM 17330]MCV3296343.1 lactococcin 972 family bacteriocin [Oenococcus kitaharae]OEY81421.1 bacteriocin [Oenococcus kitaharae]OEY82909.1 bacteriocin [Oenococcus kitaharae]OEY84547.1 bacteriocin [Oenococcus kitaharae]
MTFGSKIKKIVIVTLTVGTFGFSTIALAANVSGGTWNYGVGWNGDYGYSNYYHGSRSHWSKVVRGSETNTSTGAAGHWSKASIQHFPPTRMSYYYGF